MDYRQLGSAGIRVSTIGLGTNQFGGKVDQATVTAILAEARELGINLIDTADIYREGNSETTIGNAIKGSRSSYVLATKGYHKAGPGPNDYGASRGHLLSAIEGSLRRLQTDYIDLYQIHSWDATTPIEETLRTLDDLVRSGKVRYVGASNFAAWQLSRANLLAELRGWTPFVTIQPHYHMFERQIEQELVPYCNAYGVGILPYFPLAGGFLTGKYQQGQPAPAGSRGESNSYVQQYMTEDNFARLATLTAWAAERGHTMGDLAHAWLLAQPRVSSVISGVTSLEQLHSNARGAGWQLTAAERDEVNAILKG
ncbi:aldo/keto reductase [Chloroflexia bacterium SDU3-3]|nr:aldo/keto reductase [Chloroflexia bacterium SDU3-3]